MATLEAEPQMYPGIPGFQTVLTAICAWRDVSYLIEMCTIRCHVFSPSAGGHDSYLTIVGPHNYCVFASIVVLLPSMNSKALRELASANPAPMSIMTRKLITKDSSMARSNALRT